MPRRARLRDVDIAEVLADARAGKSIKVIAEENDLAPQLVSKYTAHLPEVVDGKRRDKRAAIGIALDAGCTVPEAAERAGARISEVVRYIWASRQEARVRPPTVETPTTETPTEPTAETPTMAEPKWKRELDARAARVAARRQRREEIRAAYLAGEPLHVIGLRFGICPSAVSRHVRDLPKRRPRGAS